MRKIWILLILTTSLAGCFSSDPCSFQSEHFLVEIHRIGSDRPSQTIFTDVDEYEELDGLEAALKEIKKVRAPQCAEDVKTNLVDWYEAIIVAKKAAILHGEDSVEFLQADRAAIEPLAAYFEARERVLNDKNIEE